MFGMIKQTRVSLFPIQFNLKKYIKSFVSIHQLSIYRWHVANRRSKSARATITGGVFVKTNLGNFTQMLFQDQTLHIEWYSVSFRSKIYSLSLYSHRIASTTAIMLHYLGIKFGCCSRRGFRLNFTNCILDDWLEIKLLTRHLVLSIFASAVMKFRFNSNSSVYYFSR